MPIYQDIARAIVQKRKAELDSLAPEKRKAVVSGIVKRLSEKSDDELITFFSARDPGITPELSRDIGAQTEALRQREIEADVPIRAEGDQRIFPQGETLPLDIQAQRLDLAKKQHEAELQSLGIETAEPLPASSLKLGFGADEVETLRNVLTQQFGEPVTVFARNQDLLFVDPRDREIKLANPDVLSSAGQALPFAGDVVGTIGGGILGGAASGATKSPLPAIAGEAAGSTAGTATGEFLRLMTGRALGVHDLSMGEIMKQSGQKGALAGATTGITGGLIASGKGLSNFLKGGIFTKTEAIRHGLSANEADTVISEVNKILKGKAAVKGTLFKKTDDAVIGSTEAEIRKNIRHAGDFIERDLSDQKALTKALDIATGATSKKGGIAVSDAAAHQVAKRVTQAKGVVSKSASNLQKQLSDIGKVRKELVGEPTREVLVKKSSAVQNAVDATWEEVKKVGGFDPASKTYGIAIPVGPETSALKKVMDRRAKAAITRIAKGPASKVFAKGKGAPDLADYSREISDLKAEIRTARKNRQFGTPAIRDMDETVKAMERDRATALIKAGKEPLLRQIEKAEQATAEFHKVFNRSIIGDLTKKNENEVFEIQSKEFVDRILKGSGEEADQLLRVIGDKPSLLGKWKEGISDAYKRKAFRNGKFNQIQSDEFLEKNKDVLGRFFPKEDIARFKKAGALATTVEKQEKQLTRIIKNAETRWGKGKLKSLDPDKLVDFVTNNSGSFARPSGQGVQTSLSKIRYVKGITRKMPEVWRTFQDEYRGAIQKQLIDPETSMIKPREISKFVNENAKEITEIAGPEYLKNLRSINKVSQILSRKPKVLTGDETKQGIIQAARSGFFPPLTRRGRAFTAAVIFDNKRAHDVLAKALLDPSTMGKVAKLAEHKQFSREVVELAISLNMIAEE